MIELEKEKVTVKLVGIQFPNIKKGYYDFFEATEEKKDIKDIPTFAPSYLTKCGRQLYYQKTGQQPSNPIDLSSRFKMYLGTLAHEGLQKIMRQIGCVVESELHHDIEYDGLEFNYFIDLVIEYNNEKFIIEIKTIYGRGFDSIKEQPKEDHLLQTCSYMAFEKIKKAIILYVGRDNGFMIQHNIESNDNLTLNNFPINEFRTKWVKNIERLKRIKQNIIDKKLPGRDYERVFKNFNGNLSENFQKDNVKYKTNWNCDYCQYKDLCWEKELKKILNYKFYIKNTFLN